MAMNGQLRLLVHAAAIESDMAPDINLQWRINAAPQWNADLGI
jgi:hypothetical protein